MQDRCLELRSTPPFRDGDGDGDGGDGGEARRFEDGEEMAREFFRQQRAAARNSDRTDGSPFDDPPNPRPKMTGLQRTPPSPPGSRNGRRLRETRSPREAMMEREYKLVEGVERGLGLQAIVAVAALAFYLYVGSTGGIGGGEGAGSNVRDFGGDDSAVYFEEVMPIQRDSERTVWL